MKIKILGPAERALVYYRIIDNEVVVFAILDCRRNPSWIRERLIKG